MSRLILLLEEESMRVLLDGLLPRLFPSLPYLCVPHEGSAASRASSARGASPAREELEAWYLAEPDALADAFGKDTLRNMGRKQRHRDPDAIRHPANALRQLVPEFQKVSGARRVAPYLTRDRNRSPSFRAFVSGVETVAAELAREAGAGARADRGGSPTR